MIPLLEEFTLKDLAMLQLDIEIYYSRSLIRSVNECLIRGTGNTRDITGVVVDMAGH